MLSLTAFDALISWQITLTLFHLCWMGLVVAGVAAVGNRLLRSGSAALRYRLYAGAMLALGMCLPMTFAVVRGMTTPAVDSSAAVSQTSLDPSARVRLSVTPANVELAASPQSALNEPTPFAPAGLEEIGKPLVLGVDASVEAAWFARLRAASPDVVFAYLLGVFAMLTKLVFAIYGGQRLRTSCRLVVDRDLLDILARQVRKLDLRLTPAIAYCDRVAVPVVVGVVRPMILLPAAMISGLAPDQVEAVLTHELAHIRRFDHLAILVQRFVEAVLFFHPAVWYLSRRVHEERESCCDDLVLEAGGDRLGYAASLLRVAELKLAANPQRRGQLAALAADGGDPSRLRQRIARLLGVTDEPAVRLNRSSLLAGAVVLLLAGGVSVNSLFSQAEKKPAEPDNKVAKLPEDPEAPNTSDASAFADRFIAALHKEQLYFLGEEQYQTLRMDFRNDLATRLKEPLPEARRHLLFQALDRDVAKRFSGRANVMTLGVDDALLRISLPEDDPAARDRIVTKAIEEHFALMGRGKAAAGDGAKDPGTAAEIATRVKQVTEHAKSIAAETIRNRAANQRAQADQVYAQFRDQFETLKWSLWIAARLELDDEQLARRDAQRKWMRELAHNLPPKKGVSHERQLDELERDWADPLNPFYQEPMSKAEFAEFITRIRRRKTDIGYVRAHLFDELVQVRIDPLREAWPVPHWDFSRGGTTSTGIDWQFITGRSSNNGSIEIPDLNRRPTEAIVDVMRLVYAPRLASSDPAEQAAWLDKQGSGDLAFDAAKNAFVVVRGAKLSLLDATDWNSADRVRLPELRQMLAGNGQDTISLTHFTKKKFADARIGEPDVRELVPNAPSLIVRTKEGRIAVVRVIGFGDGPIIQARSRPLAPNPPLHPGDPPDARPGGARNVPRDTQFSAKTGSAKAFYLGDTMLAVLYHPGFLSSGLSFTQLGNDGGWRYEGNLYLRGSQIDAEKKVSLRLTSDDPNTIFLDDKAYALDEAEGRLIVLPVEGAPIRLKRTAPLRTEADRNEIAKIVDREWRYYRGKDTLERIERLRPAWSEIQHGVQLGLAQVGPTNRFARRDLVPLALFVRNVGDAPVRASMGGEYEGLDLFDEQGEPIDIEQIFLSGAVPLYRETLKPGDAFGFHVWGLGLGAERKERGFTALRWLKPRAGKYSLRCRQSVDVEPTGEGAQLQRAHLKSGPIDFEVALAEGEVEEPEAKPSLDIIIAEHVTLWDGEIVTWDQVVQRLREIRKREGKPIQPSFYSTIGAMKNGRGMEYLPPPLGAIGNETPEGAQTPMLGLPTRASHRYDRIREPADLVPRPEQTRTGIVRTPSGRPAWRATVFSMPVASKDPVALRANPTLGEPLVLQNPLEEEWTLTDKEGRFRITVPEIHRLAVLSPQGFALVGVPKPGEPAEITLTPLSEIEVATPDQAPQLLTFDIRPFELAGDIATRFAIRDVEAGKKPKSIFVPPGRVILVRTVKTSDRGWSVEPGQWFDLKPGEKKSIVLPAPDPASVTKQP